MPVIPTGNRNKKLKGKCKKSTTLTYTIAIEGDEGSTIRVRHKEISNNDAKIYDQC